MRGVVERSRCAWPRDWSSHAGRRMNRRAPPAATAAPLRLVVQSEGGGSCVRGDEAQSSNRGRLCTKGSTLHLTMTPAALPAARDSREGEARARGARGSLGRGARHTAARFASCFASTGRLGGLLRSRASSSPRTTTFSTAGQGLIGTANIDTNSRLCMFSAVTGYIKTLGPMRRPAATRTSTTRAASSSPDPTRHSRIRCYFGARGGAGGASRSANHRGGPAADGNRALRGPAPRDPARSDVALFHACST